MDPTTFMAKLFTTKVSSFTIVTKSYILNEAGFKMNDYLTYFEHSHKKRKESFRFLLLCFEAESFNAQFLCHFAFPFFKFWIIP